MWKAIWGLNLESLGHPVCRIGQQRGIPRSHDKTRGGGVDGPASRTVEGEYDADRSAHGQFNLTLNLVAPAGVKAYNVFWPLATESLSSAPISKPVT